MSWLDRIRRDGRWLRRERLLAGGVTFVVVTLVASGCGSGSTGPSDDGGVSVASRLDIGAPGARPDVSGSRVVYRDVRDHSLVVYDIPTGRDTTVFVPGSGKQFTFRPAVSGDRSPSVKLLSMSAICEAREDRNDTICTDPWGSGTMRSGPAERYELD